MGWCIYVCDQDQTWIRSLTSLSFLTHHLSIYCTSRPQPCVPDSRWHTMESKLCSTLLPRPAVPRWSSVNTLSRAQPRNFCQCKCPRCCPPWRKSESWPLNSPFLLLLSCVLLWKWHIWHKIVHCLVVSHWKAFIVYLSCVLNWILLLGTCQTQTEHF